MTQEAPKYHRQRFLLFLLEQTGQISLIDLQQLLFLSHQEKNLNYYDSICYQNHYHSFQASSDLEVLEEKGWVHITETDCFLNDKPYLGKGVRKEERWLLSQWMRNYKGIRGDALTQVINEQNVASNNILESLMETKKTTALFTIGYEGSSLEMYLNKLIQNNVNVLYDVRKNPFSRKFGFSKGILSQILPKFGIEYRHIPELGIVSQKRKNLQSEQDYQVLFDEYKTQLPEKTIYLQELIMTINQGKSIALTCFEEKPKSCHRHCVSDYLVDNSDFGVVHL